MDFSGQTLFICIINVETCFTVWPQGQVRAALEMLTLSLVSETYLGNCLWKPPRAGVALQQALSVRTDPSSGGLSPGLSGRAEARALGLPAARV